MTCLAATQEKLVELMDRRKCNPIVVASHPRSGTHLMIDTLRLNFPECQAWKLSWEVPTCLFVDLDRTGMIHHPLHFQKVSRPIRRGTPRPVIKTHALPDFSRFFGDARQIPFSENLARWLTDHAKFVYMYRDVRSALASAYAFDHAPGSSESLSDYIRQPAHGYPTRVHAWVAHVKQWLDHPQAHCVAMEGLLTDPAGALSGIAGKFQMTMPAMVRLPRPRTSFHTMARIIRGISTCVESTALFNVKLGRQSHNWRISLQPEDRQFIVDIAGDLLIRLGYETDQTWTLNPFDQRTNPQFRRAVVQTQNG